MQSEEVGLITIVAFGVGAVVVLVGFAAIAGLVFYLVRRSRKTRASEES